jgi:D-alanine transfer protein
MSDSLERSSSISKPGYRTPVSASTNCEPHTDRVTVECVATPRLIASVLATGLFFAALMVVSWCAEWVAARHIYALARSRHAQKSLGLALQREALRHDDLLLLYGTSEIDRIELYHARDVFADGPTGFSTFGIGRPGGLVFSAVQSIGALGSSLRGRKVVVSLSPTMFNLANDERLTQRYAGNLYPLQALTLLLERDLTVGLRRTFARRMLARPSMLEGNNTLKAFAMTTADDRSVMRPTYYALLPLAVLQRELLAVQDEILELGHILTTTLPASDPARTRRPLDWDALIEDATLKYKPTASMNRFGLHDGWWRTQEHPTAQQRPGSNDQAWVEQMSRADAWIDLELLLQELSELDANALILSMPFHGPFLDYTGVSAAARAQYYTRVRHLAAQYGVRAMVLDDREAEPYFFRDLGSHPSPKGWIIYDQILDAFYHDALD